MKTQKQFRTNVLGFPLLLLNVPMEQIRGEWVPAINYDLLEELMGFFVPLKRSRLTGNELKFLRQHLGLSQEEFGKFFEYTRQGVKKWEDIGNAIPPMKWSTERDIRLFVLSKKIRGKVFDPGIFHKAYEFLETKASAQVIEISIPADKIDKPEQIVEECLAAG